MRIRLILVWSIFLSASLFSPGIIQFAAANPLPAYSHYQATSGIAINPSSNVTMPNAEVNISISTQNVNPEENRFNHSISLQSQFILNCDESQNLSIAFAYPKEWSYVEVDVDIAMDIKFNGIHLDYVTIDGLSLITQSMSPVEIEQWTFLQGLYLALFNASLIEDYDNLLELSAELCISTTVNVFEFRYCVGTARAWNGNTTEIVRITHENCDLFPHYEFNPDSSLTLIENNPQITGVWNIDINQFQEDFVSFLGTEWTIPYSTDQSLLLVTTLVLPAIGVAAIVLVIIRRRRF